MAALLNGVTESIYTNAKYKVYEQAILCTLTLYGIWIASRKWRETGGRGKGGIYVRVEEGGNVASMTQADDIYVVLIYILQYTKVPGISSVIFKIFWI